LKEFSLCEPTKLEELLDMIAQKDQFKLLAGGTDLIPKWKKGQLDFENVINLKKIEELDFIEFTEEGLEIGALVKVDDLIKNELLRKKYPALWQASRKHSSQLTRNLATLVGNICNASPAADLIPPLLAYNAKLKIKGSNEECVMELKDFFTGPGQTKLSEDEIVVSVQVPTPDENLKSKFIKNGKRKAHEIAVVNCAISYVEDDEVISDLKVSLGAVAPTPLLLELDWFTEINSDNFVRLNKVIKDQISPITDQRSTGWYRKEVIQVMVRRAIEEATNSV
jgi:CO/xanthine dehydrogenase FAD-binding subunit